MPGLPPPLHYAWHHPTVPNQFSLFITFIAATDNYIFQTSKNNLYHLHTDMGIWKFLFHLDTYASMPESMHFH